MGQVADGAGLSLRAVYEHWAGKDELLVARFAPGWVDHLRIDDEQAAERRVEPTHAAGTHPR